MVGAGSHGASISAYLRGVAVCAVMMLVGSCAAVGQSAGTQAEGEWRTDLLAWRAKQAADLSAPEGWLSLVALGWLQPGENSIGLAADNRIRLSGHVPEHLAIIVVDGNHLMLKAPAGGFPAELRLDSQMPVEGPMRADDEKASVLGTENLRLVVLHRGDRYALRVKDADSPTRTGFKGLHWYAPEARYRVTAKWIPFTPPHTEQVPTAIGTTLDLKAPGLAEVTIDGKTVQLEPVLESADTKQLFFILRDATSHTTTYEASRFLYTGLPDHGLDQPGTLVMDFNRLENPPCAYTPYATCPLPPYINRLAISIPAGEQRYNH